MILVQTPPGRYPDRPSPGTGPQRHRTGDFGDDRRIRSSDPETERRLIDLEVYRKVFVENTFIGLNQKRGTGLLVTVRFRSRPTEESLRRTELTLILHPLRNRDVPSRPTRKSGLHGKRFGSSRPERRPEVIQSNRRISSPHPEVVSPDPRWVCHWGYYILGRVTSVSLCTWVSRNVRMFVTVEV